jgi:hypothetical protein
MTAQALARGPAATRSSRQRSCYAARRLSARLPLRGVARTYSRRPVCPTPAGVRHGSPPRRRAASRCSPTAQMVEQFCQPNGRGLEGLGRRHCGAPPQAPRRHRRPSHWCRRKSTDTIIHAATDSAGCCLGEEQERLLPPALRRLPGRSAMHGNDQLCGLRAVRRSAESSWRAIT